MTPVELREREIICERAGVQPSADAIHRAMNAYTIQAKNLVKLVSIDSDGTRNFEVISQTDESVVYHVSFDDKFPTTTCTCPDWTRQDRAEAQLGIPFSTKICKHGIAARIAWNLVTYRLDDNPNRAYMTRRELKHYLDRKFGDKAWRLEKMSKTKARIVDLRNAKPQRTIWKVYAGNKGFQISAR